MSDTINNKAAQPEWRTLCQDAMLELDPIKLLQRIAEAHAVLVKQLEDNHPSRDQLAMQDALRVMRTLREIAEREQRNRRLTA